MQHCSFLQLAITTSFLYQNVPFCGPTLFPKTHVRNEKCIQNSVGKPEGKRPLRLARSRWRDRHWRLWTDWDGSGWDPLMYSYELFPENIVNFETGLENINYLDKRSLVATLMVWKFIILCWWSIKLISLFRNELLFILIYKDACLHHEGDVSPSQ